MMRIIADAPLLKPRCNGPQWHMPARARAFACGQCPQPVNAPARAPQGLSCLTDGIHSGASSRGEDSAGRRPRRAPSPNSGCNSRDRSRVHSIFLKKSRMAGEIDTARCPECGSLLVLVGIRHLCRGPGPGAPRPGAGRPPIGKKAMTGAERQRRSCALRKDKA
jgi:hypothetical protein